MKLLLIIIVIDIEAFKTALKRNKTLLRKVSFAKGTINNYNKDVDNFIYF